MEKADQPTQREPFPQSALFPISKERVRAEDALTRSLAAARDRVSAGPVVPAVDMIAFERDLAAFDFRVPRPLDDVLAWTIACLETGVVHTHHPRYFGLFNPSPTFPAQCADRIAAYFNPQLATFTTSPVPVSIEAHVARALAERAGLPSGSSGHFTTGGAEANLTAAVCALTRLDTSFADRGARAFTGPPAVYVSREAHAAWLKIAHITGIGRSAIRFVNTDGCGRMDPETLADTIAVDQAEGRIPVLVVATAGTTGGGMIDPLRDCSVIARAAGAWFHVDAAWGGAVLVSERWRHLMSGLEEADSITIDAHKWLAATMSCGLFITRHPDTLSAAFRVSTGYMPPSDASRDPYATTVQWSRRFAGLRLFLALATSGWSGLAAHLERAIDLAELLRGEVLVRGWKVANASSLAVLCLEPPAGSRDVPEVVRRVVASGHSWISVTSFERRDTVRVCLTNGETTPQDVLLLADLLQASSKLAVPSD